MDFIAARRTWAHVLEQARKEGTLQPRPVHGDPKVNYVMIEESTGRAISLVDLDTVKPGLVHSDIGDCMRSGCNPLGEETEDWEAVRFDPDIGEAILTGYLTEARHFLTPADYDYLFDFTRLLAFELGVRFFTDHLAGNVYFKVKHDRHNLLCALVQFKLTESIEAHERDIRVIIQSQRVENLSSPGKFSKVSFILRQGEILGVAGLVGAGRSEVAQAIFGVDPNVTGKVFVHGKEMPLGSVTTALASGIGFLPEDRKRMGLVLSMNCRENTSLAILSRLNLGGFVKRRQERSIVQRYVDQLRVKTPSLETGIDGLSGGNQQKVALAKWLARECDILIVDEPTRGVDVGAMAE